MRSLLPSSMVINVRDLLYRFLFTSDVSLMVSMLLLSSNGLRTIPISRSEEKSSLWSIADVSCISLLIMLSLKKCACFFGTMKIVVFITVFCFLICLGGVCFVLHVTLSFPVKIINASINVGTMRKVYILIMLPKSSRLAALLALSLAC